MIISGESGAGKTEAAYVFVSAGVRACVCVYIYFHRLTFLRRIGVNHFLSVWVHHPANVRVWR